MEQLQLLGLQINFLQVELFTTLSHMIHQVVLLIMDMHFQELHIMSLQKLNSHSVTVTGLGEVALFSYCRIISEGSPVSISSLHTVGGELLSKLAGPPFANGMNTNNNNVQIFECDILKGKVYYLSRCILQGSRRRKEDEKRKFLVQKLEL